MRYAKPIIEGQSVLFTVLNEEKIYRDKPERSNSSKKIKNLIKNCDVLIEQFRPGVMKRLGLD